MNDQEFFPSNSCPCESSDNEEVFLENEATICIKTAYQSRSKFCNGIRFSTNPFS